MAGTVSKKFGSFVFEGKGVENNVVEVRLVGTDVVFEDFESNLVKAGTGCTQLTAFKAKCAVSGDLLVQLLGGSGDDELTSFLAAPAVVYIDAGPGDDVLRGGPANDTLIGGHGRDLLVGNGGYDVIEGGLLRDTVDYSQEALSGVVVVVGKPNGPPMPNDHVKEDVEVIIGTGGNDTLIGDDGDFEDIGDDDWIYGGGGSDLILGGRLEGSGNDYLDGGPGDDIIDGGIGNDTVIGGGGVDQLSGSTGDDILSSPDGVVDFTLECAGGNDTAYIDGPPINDPTRFCETVVPN
jgi:Ca2+-binding RTX toxin-like protein